MSIELHSPFYLNGRAASEDSLLIHSPCQALWIVGTPLVCEENIRVFEAYI